MSMAVLVVLTDVLLEGFSLRELSAITFGLAIGALIAFFLNESPLFRPLQNDPDLGATFQLVSIALSPVGMPSNT